VLSLSKDRVTAAPRYHGAIFNDTLSATRVIAVYHGNVYAHYVLKGIFQRKVS
jgi:hypothetical protein